MLLTDTECRTAKPKEKPYKLTDGNGLYLELKQNYSPALPVASAMRVLGL